MKSLFHRRMGMLALSSLLGTSALASPDVAGEPAAAAVRPSVRDIRRTLRQGDTGPEVRSLYEYLRNYGYFPHPSMETLYPGWKPAVATSPADPQRFDASMEAAVRLYQQAHGLKVDGTVHDEMRVLLGKPRCGVPDLYKPLKRVKKSDGTTEYAPLGPTWSDRNVGYVFDNYTGDLAQANARNALIGAFARWSAVTDITLSEAFWPWDQDIHIGWFTLDHGDGYPFDGNANNPNTLAHAFQPEYGEMHFDDAEDWRDDGTGTDLATVALHEAGHAIGLDHSADNTAVMFASYQGLRRNLAHDDVSGIISRYGDRRKLSWNSSGSIPGKWCTRIDEGADPHSWGDNYFCSDVNEGIRWSNSGPISGMRCTQIIEPAEPAAHTWNDNYICVPTSSSLYFTWVYDGPILGKQCVSWNEFGDPQTWDDNFLCY